MTPLFPVLRFALAALELPVRWPTTSLHQARRNAMVAATELAERRRERLEVEAFLAGRPAPGLGRRERQGVI